MHGLTRLTVLDEHGSCLRRRNLAHDRRRDPFGLERFEEAVHAVRAYGGL
jgi:hypothetical protein